MTENTIESPSTPENSSPARILMPWERRLGLILGSYLTGYGAMVAYEQQPDGNGVWVCVFITTCLIIAALQSTIKNPKP